MSRRLIFVVLFVLAQTIVGPGTVDAQTTCPCTDQRDFGSCLMGPPAVYPGEFPGTVEVVSTTIGLEDISLIYIADLFTGFTYRYDVTDSQGIIGPNTPYDIFISPGGSRTTTGLAFNPLDGMLYWAIECNPAECTGVELIRTQLNLSGAEVVGRIDLEGLKEKLDLPSVGSMGEITFHAERGRFWGADMTNDLYFEFQDDGSLYLDDSDMPVYFNCPEWNQDRGGSYGGGITYAMVNGVSYLDIPVGNLLEGNAVRVMRIHASAGGEGEFAYEIGTPSGIYYNIQQATGSLNSTSGIAYFPSTCSEVDHTEIVLDIVPPSQGTSRIFQLSADDPKSAGLSHLDATAAGNSVQLSWLALKPYAKLEILRQSIPGGEVTSVATFTDYLNDPRSYQDRNVIDGLYEYSGEVTPPAGGRKLPPARQTVNVGQGSIISTTSYRVPTRPQDVTPQGMTFIGSTQQLMVVDYKTGYGHLFNIDLEYQGSLAGPFIRDAHTGATTTGVTWDQENDLLVWVMMTSQLIPYVMVTDTSGDLVGDKRRKRITIPGNVARAPIFQDISYDPYTKDIWAIDTANMLAYTFDNQGQLTGKSLTEQVPVPRSPNGEFSGALAVQKSDKNRLILDLGVGKASTGVPGEMARMEYQRSLDEWVRLPGEETLTLQLRIILESNQISGMVSVEEESNHYQFVVGRDSLVIYKLNMDSGLEGEEFKRGDVNSDSEFNLSDAILILNYLFKAGPELDCEDAADVNDDEVLDISDPILLFSYMFKGGNEPLPPFEECGRDFDLPLTCEMAECQ